MQMLIRLHYFQRENYLELMMYSKLLRNQHSILIHKKYQILLNYLSKQQILINKVVMFHLFYLVT